MPIHKISDPQASSICAMEISDEGDPSLGAVQRLQGSGHIEWICPSAEEISGDPPEDPRCQLTLCSTNSLEM